MIHSPRQRRHLALSAFLGSFTRAFRTPKPRQRGLKFKLCTAVLTVMAVLMGTAVAASANAANPYVNPPTFVTGGTADAAHGTVHQNADGTYTVTSGTVAVAVNGTWNWGALSGSSQQGNCTGRFGVGWAVDWAGVTSSANSSLPGLQGALQIGRRNGTGFFHIFDADMIASGNYYGFTGPCTAQELAIEPGHPSGPWSSSHTYSQGQVIPEQLCVNMYDLHGTPGNLKAGDEDPLGNHDNSIQTNDFNPKQGVGYCFTPTFVNTQHLIAHIYDCTNGATTTEVVGTVSAAGPTNIAAKANPLDDSTVKAGDYKVGATAPSGYHFVQCQAGLPPDTDGTATRAVNVPVDGTGTAIFYVAKNPINPALDIFKAASATQVTAGDAFDYLLVVNSIGESTATSVMVNDDIPAGLTVVGTPTTTSGTCGVSGQHVSCSLGDLVAASAAGTKSVSIGIHVRTSPTTCGVVTNTGHASASNVNTVDSNPVDVTVNCPVNGNLDKTNDADGDGSFHKSETADLPGMDVPFKVTLTNTSAIPVVIDSISDAFGSTTISPTCAAAFLGQTVAPGASLTCDFVVPNYSPAAGSSLINEVTVNVHDAGNPGKTKTLTSTSVVNTAGQPPLSLTIVKTNDANANGVFTDDETGVALADVNFRVTITNNSSVPVVIDSVSDVWDGVTEFSPACAATIVGTTLAANGGTVSCDFTVARYVPVSTDGAKVNTVTVKGHQPGNPGNTTTGQDTSTVRGEPAAVLGTTVVRALPRTGANTFGLMGIAILLLIVGAGLMLLGSGRIPQAALALRSSALVAPVMYSRSVVVVERKLGGASRRKLKGR